MRNYPAMLVLGMAAFFPQTYSAALQVAQQPVAPIAPVPPAKAAANSSKSSNTAKKQRHADDFLIIGTVFTPQALALAGAELRVRRMGESKWHWKTATNSRGDFAVRVPRGASYEVSVAAKGLAIHTLTVDAVQTGDTQQRLSIRMEPPPGGTK